MTLQLRTTPTDFKRFTTAIYGLTGSGKTTCALTFPKPIIALGFDRALDDPIRRMIAQGKLQSGDVQFENFFQGGVLDVEKAKRLRSIVQEAVRTVLGQGGTLVMDGAKGFESVVNLSVLEGKSGMKALPDGTVAPFGYAPINDYYRSLFRAFENEPAFLVWTAPTEDEYRGGNRTGRYIPAWWKWTKELSQVVIHSFTYPPVPRSHEEMQNQPEREAGVKFYGGLEKFSPDPDYQGEIVESLDFGGMYMRAFGEDYNG